MCSGNDYVFSGENLNLPPGYRFCPTNAELIFYLQRKINGQPLPPNEIIEANVKYPKGDRPNRAAGGDGYWKATGTERPIMEGARKIGFKQSLVYYVGRSPGGVKTNWIMHEFRVPQISPRPFASSNPMLLDQYVLYKIYHKTGQNENEEGEGEGVEDDNMVIHEPNQTIDGQNFQDQQNASYGVANAVTQAMQCHGNIVINPTNQTIDGQSFHNQKSISYGVASAFTQVVHCNGESIINSANQTIHGQFESYNDHHQTFYTFGDSTTQEVQQYNDNMMIVGHCNGESIINSANQTIHGQFESYNDHQPRTFYTFGDSTTQEVQQYNDNMMIVGHCNGESIINSANQTIHGQFEMHCNGESIINSANQTIHGQFESYNDHQPRTFYTFGDSTTQEVQQYNDNMMIDSANQTIEEDNGSSQTIDELLRSFYDDQSSQSIDELFQSNYSDHQSHVHDQPTQTIDGQFWSCTDGLPNCLLNLSLLPSQTQIRWVVFAQAMQFTFSRKKQIVPYSTCSSTKLAYHALARTATQLTWLQSLNILPLMSKRCVRIHYHIP
ncbi:NAC domain [Dillenia turbinata]|uniref:NAC domain n=1 Tax=Dillenia turbinata TaxID=194707 RepID=A0AAN8YYK3_9MAGN